MNNFKKELEDLINKHNVENTTNNTPDFILAQYLIDCLVAFDRASQQRDNWYGQKSNERPKTD